MVAYLVRRNQAVEDCCVTAFSISVVIACLDHAIHSVTLMLSFRLNGMDARIKSGHDVSPEGLERTHDKPGSGAVHHSLG
jgi:hypothetical protein